MEKPIAAIEFGSKKLKLVIGYELNGQVYVIYSLELNRKLNIIYPFFNIPRMKYFIYEFLP